MEAPFLSLVRRGRGITIKYNVRFQVGLRSEKFQLDQIQNARLSAIINFNMPDTVQTVPDG